VQRVGRHACRPAFDLSVAIRAQKYTLLRLDAQLLESDSDALGVDLVALLRRLQVMEVERSHVPVVATDAASTARLSDERSLNLPTSPRDCIRSAALATVGTTPVKPEAGVSMATAVHRHAGEPSLLGGLRKLRLWPARRAMRLQPKADQPVAYRRLAAIDRCSDLRDRHTGRDQSLEVLPGIPPRAACFARPGALRPCFASQYATVLGWRPTRLPICSSEKPSATQARSDSASIDTLR